MAAGRITADQAAELLTVAEAHAEQPTETDTRVAELETRVSSVETTLNVLAGIDEPDAVTNTTEEPQEVQENV